jgi:hypothetical protein
MSKNKPWEDTVQNTSLPLKQRAETWLENQGYPLEYRTAEALWKYNFSVGQGFYLPGDEERNGLEVDLLATYAERQTRQTDFHMLIECKVIPKPRAWIAVADTNQVPKGIDAGLGRTAVCQLIEDERLEDFHGFTTPLVESVTATRLHTMDKLVSGDDEKVSAFSAVTQLVRRCVSYLRVRDQTDDLRCLVGLVVPVLIVEGDLAIADWNHELRKFTAEPAQQIWVAWGGHQGWHLPWFTFAVVHIDAIEAFSKRMSQWATDWSSPAERGLEKIRHRITQRGVYGRQELQIPLNNAYTPKK